MVSLDTARNAVGIIGNIISVCLFLSPMPTFYKIWKQRSVEQFSPTPYLASLVNCLVWVLYGLPMIHPNSTLVITTNAAGTAIEIFYILLFLIYSNNQKQNQRLKVLSVVALEVVFIAFFAFLVLHFAHTTEKRTLIVGIVAICFNVLMYAAPLTCMKLVLTTKSVEYMPFTLSLAGLLNGVCWTSYSLIGFDKFIFIPNCIGMLFSIGQLLLYATYYGNTQKILAERKAKLAMGLSEIVVCEEPQIPTTNGLYRQNDIH